MRPHPKDAIAETIVPALRIIEDTLWESAQARLAAEAAPMVQQAKAAFWDRRRPKHLLSGKVVCGCCGRLFSVVGRDYLGCGAARASQGCTNQRLVRRPKLEAQVLEVLGSRLMRPDLVEVFCQEFIAEWNRMSAEASAGIEVRRRELKVIERKIENILEAIADGLKAAGIQQKLSELEARRNELQAASAEASTVPPALHPNLARTYAERVAELRRGIDAGKGQDVLEAARALIDKVIVTPGEDPDDPPGIELVGQLMAMLKAAGGFPNGDDAKCRGLVSGLSTCSVKGTMRAHTHLY